MTGKPRGRRAILTVVLTLVIATFAPAPDAEEASISGTITLAPAAKGKLPREPLLIISASKTTDPKKAPILVKRVPAPEFPYRYTLGEEDITLVGSRFEGKFYVAARVEPGDAGGAPAGALEGAHPRNPISVGAKGVDITITAPGPPPAAEAPAGSRKPRGASVVRVGLLWSGSTPFGTSSVPEELRLAFRELGYVDDQNIAFEPRYAEGRYDRLPELAASLVDLKVDVILAAGDSAAVMAAKHATIRVPIVMMALADTVQLGFVASLARPSGNLTGLSFPLAAMAGKQLELLKKAIPPARRVGVLWNPANPGHAPVLEKLKTSAQRLELELQLLEVRGPDDFEGAVATLKRSRADGLLVLWDPMLYAHAGRLTLLALRHRLPTISTYREFAEAAGLMTYGPRLADIFRGAASYVDKIVRGGNPADLPVEQPLRFELVLNLATAKALGVALPESILVRADRVLQ
jgi:putative ABC transport system substrate-binding protein